MHVHVSGVRLTHACAHPQAGAACAVQHADGLGAQTIVWAQLHPTPAPEPQRTPTPTPAPARARARAWTAYVDRLITTGAAALRCAQCVYHARLHAARFAPSPPRARRALAVCMRPSSPQHCETGRGLSEAVARLRRACTTDASAGQLDAHIQAARQHMHLFAEQGVGSGGGNGPAPARRPSPPPSPSPSPGGGGGGGSRAGGDVAATDIASRLEIIELQPLSKGQRGRAPLSTCPSTCPSPLTITPHPSPLTPHPSPFTPRPSPRTPHPSPRTPHPSPRTHPLTRPAKGWRLHQARLGRRGAARTW